MAKRKKIGELKSSPFTTVNLMMPIKISICGTPEIREKWNILFPDSKTRKAKKLDMINKSDFILNNIRKDLDIKNNNDIFLDIEDSRRWDNKKIEGLMIELGHANIQGYISFIVERELEKKERKLIAEQKKRAVDGDNK